MEESMVQEPERNAFGHAPARLRSEQACEPMASSSAKLRSNPSAVLLLLLLLPLLLLLLFKLILLVLLMLLLGG
jgi:hypothetical protein